MSRLINTAVEAIDALGGTKAVAELFGFDMRVVSNWRKRGLPPETFLAFQKALSDKGKIAPPSLWRQHETAS